VSSQIYASHARIYGECVDWALDSSCDLEGLPMTKQMLSSERASYALFTPAVLQACSIHSAEDAKERRQRVRAGFEKVIAWIKHLPDHELARLRPERS
jgi:hypothetical protein